MLTLRRFFSIRQLIKGSTEAAIAENNTSSYPDLDFEYLCDKNNLLEIQTNIQKRKNIGNIERLHELLETAKTSPNCAFDELYETAKYIPNRTHPAIVDYKEPRVLRIVGDKPVFATKPLDFDTIAKATRLYRREHIGNVAGPRSYYILGQLANLEHALIKYSVDFLLKNKFRFISVPDLLPASVIESCGMNLKTDHHQLYYINRKNSDGQKYCLSGTSEMALAYYYSNKVHRLEDLPVRCAAVSRCYRAEASSIFEERGIYRVHQFNKVEMFSICLPSQSEQVHKEFLSLQTELLTNLGVHFKVLDMPPNELGSAAFRKFDIEAWMPGRGMYGEVSSCSNCTDYQSRRLRIKYGDRDGDGDDFVHTVNGTACAAPRLLITLIETNQSDDKTVKVPEVLKPFLFNSDPIGRQRRIPNLKLINKVA